MDMPVTADYKVLLCRPMVLENSYLLDRATKVQHTVAGFFQFGPCDDRRFPGFPGGQTAHAHCSLEDKRGTAR
jgi:hypothetical protein